MITIPLHAGRACLPTHHPTTAQSLYKNRLCKCKPRASSSSSSSEERGSKPGDDADDIRPQTAEAFSELIGLCRAWEKKNSPLASLALEGALCCLRSLKSSPAKGKGKGGGGGGDPLEGTLKALATAVGDFFGKKRGGGFTVVQVRYSSGGGGRLCRAGMDGGMLFVALSINRFVGAFVDACMG